MSREKNCPKVQQMSSKFYKPKVCKVTEISPTSSLPELHPYFIHSGEVSLPLSHPTKGTISQNLF